MGPRDFVSAYTSHSMRMELESLSVIRSVELQLLTTFEFKVVCELLFRTILTNITGRQGCAPSSIPESRARTHNRMPRSMPVCTPHCTHSIDRGDGSMDVSHLHRQAPLLPMDLYLAERPAGVNQRDASHAPVFSADIAPDFMYALHAYMNFPGPGWPGINLGWLLH